MQNRDSILEVAVKAKEYAQNHILASNTHLSANHYSPEKLTEVTKLIDDINLLQYEKDPLNIESDESLRRYYQHLDAVKKHAVGNCNEYAMLALEYVSKTTELTAEIFNIETGDHAFLVVGRADGSDPSNPLSWGESAYICDPWSNKVYKASDYLELVDGYTNLSHYKVLEEQVNVIESYDPVEDALAPMEMNAEILRNANSPENIENLRLGFINKLQSLIVDLATIQKDLESLPVPQGLPEVKSGRSSIVHQKIIMIDNEIKAIRAEILSSKRDENVTYQDLRSQLREKLSSVITRTELIKEVNREQIEKVMKPFHIYKNWQTHHDSIEFKMASLPKDKKLPIQNAFDYIHNVEALLLKHLNTYHPTADKRLQTLQNVNKLVESSYEKLFQAKNAGEANQVATDLKKSIQMTYQSTGKTLGGTFFSEDPIRLHLGKVLKENAIDFKPTPLVELGSDKKSHQVVFRARPGKK